MLSRLLYLAALLLLAGMSPLESLRWSHRPVLVFAPGENDSRLTAQLARFGGVAAALAERDIALSVVVGTSPRAVLGPRLDDTADALRARYAIVPEDFAVILIGKDGGEKFSSVEVVDPATLFALIDTMPMRRREMRER